MVEKKKIEYDTPLEKATLELANEVEKELQASNGANTACAYISSDSGKTHVMFLAATDLFFVKSAWQEVRVLLEKLEKENKERKACRTTGAKGNPAGLRPS